MNEKEPTLLHNLKNITKVVQARQEQEDEKWWEEARLQEAKEKELAEQSFQKEVRELEDWALKRAQKGFDWMMINRIYYTDIDVGSWKAIGFETRRLETRMILGDKRRTLDYFENKGFRIIFGHYVGEHDYDDPSYDFVGATWGNDRKYIVTSLYDDTGSRFSISCQNATND